MVTSGKGPEGLEMKSGKETFRCLSNCSVVLFVFTMCMNFLFTADMFFKMNQTTVMMI